MEKSLRNWKIFLKNKFQLKYRRIMDTLDEQSKTSIELNESYRKLFKSMQNYDAPLMERRRSSISKSSGLKERNLVNVSFK